MQTSCKGMWGRAAISAKLTRFPWLQTTPDFAALLEMLSRSKCTSVLRRSIQSGSGSCVSSSVRSRSANLALEERHCCLTYRRRISTETVAEMSEEESYRAAKPFNTIPGPRGPYSIPYIGTRLLFKPFSDYPMEGIGHVLNGLHEVYGPIVRVRMRSQWVVLLEDINDIQTVFRKQEKFPYRVPVQPDLTYAERENPRLHRLTNVQNTNHIFDSNGEEWQRIRSPLNVRLNRPTSAVGYLSSQEAVAVDFAHSLYRLQSASPQVLQELFFGYAAESIAVVCFNKRLGFLSAQGEPNEEALRLLQCYKAINTAVSDCMFGKRFLYLFFRDSFYRRYSEARAATLSHADTCIKEAMLELEKMKREGTLEEDEPNFLLSLLSEKTFDYLDVLGVVDQFMTAGSDSEKLAAEILGELGPHGALTADALNRLTYMKAAVNESMRIHYPVPAGPRRKLPFDTVLSGYQVPKGTNAIANSSRVAISPLCYDEPARYLPERWLRKDGGQRDRAIPPLAHVPFGFGPRMCIGRRFALQEMYLAVVKVLQAYRIGLQDNEGHLETTFTPFCGPAKPVAFTFTPRQ
ncbi:hypothetical protein BaRGS_00016257 [Batillaria attramentaria]|uniref:Cytochrome P450 n=1 Tax=Batillaria attramentaria TaxID=370345 RepID=A0ABD0KZZ6_9CAEN